MQRKRKKGKYQNSIAVISAIQSHDPSSCGPMLSTSLELHIECHPCLQDTLQIRDFESARRLLDIEAPHKPIDALIWIILVQTDRRLAIYKEEYGGPPFRMLESLPLLNLKHVQLRVSQYEVRQHFDFG